MVNLGCARELSMSWSTVWMLVTGWSGSTLEICARTPEMRLLGSTAVRTSKFMLPQGNCWNGK